METKYCIAILMNVYTSMCCNLIDKAENNLNEYIFLYFTTCIPTEINECASMPCLNNATCNDLIGIYDCFCPPGWTGQRCESSA